jgi:hypothetical protein
MSARDTQKGVLFRLLSLGLKEFDYLVYGWDYDSDTRLKKNTKAKFT